MSRLMSVAFTEDAVRARTKTVTRRKGWWEDKNGRRLLKPGDRLTLCRKVMGRKRGEPLVRLVDVEIWRVDREVLCSLQRSEEYARKELRAEGFPVLYGEDWMTASSLFLRHYFYDAQKMRPVDEVTRIEWRYLDTREDACYRDSGCDERSHSLPCNDAWFGRSA